MVIGLTTTCAISAYHHYSCEFEPRSRRGVLDTTVEGAGRKAKRMVLQCINGVGSNPVEGRTKI
jgi:hypothetical protein